MRAAQGIDVYLTRLTSSGSTATGWTAAAMRWATPAGRTMLQIMPDGSGGVYATWSGGPDAEDVYLQRLEGAVHAGWPEGVKCTDADYAQRSPHVKRAGSTWPGMITATGGLCPAGHRWPAWLRLAPGRVPRVHRLR